MNNLKIFKAKDLLKKSTRDIDGFIFILIGYLSNTKIDLDDAFVIADFTTHQYYVVALNNPGWCDPDSFNKVFSEV